jgi:2-dehydropantoate 2-reductase
MRYIIYGAGAIGGTVGSSLFEQGNQVILIARGAHLTAMKEQGLHAIYPDKELHQQIPAVGHPSEINFHDDDVVFLCMKTQDTEDALEQLEAFAGSDLPLFCAQNGVENERLAARRFANVYGVNVMMPCSFLDPGIVRCSSAPISGVLDMGRFPSGTDATIEAVSADLEAASFKAGVMPDIRRWKYAKLLRNLGNALQGACGLEADTAELRSQIEAEAANVYRAAGIEHASAAEFDERSRYAPPAGGGGSSWQSLARGTGSIETDYLNGEIVLMGRLHGVPTPVNEAVRRLANRVARQHLQPGAVTPADIRRLAAQLAG